MIKCSFCLIPTTPKQLTDCDLHPTEKCLENLCYACYETHKKAHKLDKDSKIINRMLEGWKSGKKIPQKGNHTGII